MYGSMEEPKVSYNPKAHRKLPLLGIEDSNRNNYIIRIIMCFTVCSLLIVMLVVSRSSEGSKAPIRSAVTFLDSNPPALLIDDSNTIFQFTVNDIADSNSPVPLSSYKGAKAYLIVNVASR